MKDPPFAYDSGITATFGADQDTASSDPVWTARPEGAITYSIKEPEGAKLTGKVEIASDTGIVTVKKDAPAATEDWTVTAAVGGTPYTAPIKITVNPKPAPITSLTYAPSSIDANKDIRITPLKATVDPALPNDATAEYTVEPPLPAGLAINFDTGEKLPEPPRRSRNRRRAPLPSP